MSSSSSSINLLRASLGPKASSIPDHELESYLRQLILQESLEKKKKYDSIGTSAYLLEETRSKMKIQENFIKNTLRDLKSHNKRLDKKEKNKEKEKENSTKAPKAKSIKLDKPSLKTKPSKDKSKYY